MKFIKSLTVQDWTLILGAGSLIAGVAQIYVPAAYIVAGIGLITLSIRGV